METIPLQAIPNQEVTAPLGGRRWTIQIKQAREHMAATVTVDGAVLVKGQRLVAGSPLLPYPHLQTFGNLWLVTDGDDEIDYAQFGVTQELIYVDP